MDDMVESKLPGGHNPSGSNIQARNNNHDQNSVARDWVAKNGGDNMAIAFRSAACWGAPETVAATVGEPSMSVHLTARSKFQVRSKS
jgi:hypothetical protein